MSSTAKPRLSQQLPIWALSVVSTLWLAAIATGLVEASTQVAMLALAPHVFARIIAGFVPEWHAPGGRPYRFAGALAQILSLLALACVHYDWLARAWFGAAVAALAASIALQVVGWVVDFRGGIAWRRALAPPEPTSSSEDGT